MRGPDLFHPCKILVDGKFVRAFQVKCGRCGKPASVQANGFKKSSDDEREVEFVSRKFRKMGWKITGSVSQNRCPACFAAVRAAASKKVVPMVDRKIEVPHLKPVDAVRQMGREDRRIIFEKVNDCYLDEARGYSGDWTDAKVAEDLGVPRAWVTTIRDENFGPEGSNEQIRTCLIEAKKLLEETRAAAKELEPAVTLLRSLLNKAEKIERTIIDIEKTLR